MGRGRAAKTEPPVLRGENGQEKAPAHFLQFHYGVLILAVKATLRAPLRSGLDRCGEREEDVEPHGHEVGDVSVSLALNPLAGHTK